MKNGWKMKKPALDSRFWMRALAVLFAAALLFTMISSVSASMTVAKVSVQSPSARKIEHTVKAQGQVEIRREAAEVTQADLLVESVSVRVGESVEEGEELFRIDEESLQEKMQEISNEIETLELQNDALAQNESLAASKKQTDMNRAREDYADVTEKNQKAVDSAKQALSEAQKELSETSSALAGAEEEVNSQQQLVQNLKNQLSECTAAKEQAEAEVKTAQEAVENQKTVLEELEKDPDSQEEALQEAKEELLRLTEELSGRQEELSQAEEAAKTAEEDYEAAAAELQNKQNSLTALQQQAEEGENAVREKESSLSDTKDAGQQEKKAAARAIEDASAGESADVSQEINALSIEDWQKKLDKLQKLKDADGIVTASQGGVVTKVYVEPGQKTTDTTAVMLGDVSSGYLFTVQIDKDDAEYVSVGDQVSIKGVGKTAEECPVISIGTDETGEMVTVTAQLQSDLFSAGETATMETSRSSETYNYTIPAEALIQENNKTYVMISDTEQTVLGSQYVARKLEVELLDKNASYAAIDSEGISDSTWIITDQDRYVEAGDRIRLTEE